MCVEWRWAGDVEGQCRLNAGGGEGCGSHGVGDVGDAGGDADADVIQRTQW